MKYHTKICTFKKAIKDLMYARRIHREYVEHPRMCRGNVGIVSKNYECETDAIREIYRNKAETELRKVITEQCPCVYCEQAWCSQSIDADGKNRYNDGCYKDCEKAEKWLMKKCEPKCLQM